MGARHAREHLARQHLLQRLTKAIGLLTGYPDLPPPTTRARHASHTDVSLRRLSRPARAHRRRGATLCHVSRTSSSFRSRRRSKRDAHCPRNMFVPARRARSRADRARVVPDSHRRALGHGAADPPASWHGCAQRASDFTPLPLADVPRELRDLVTAFNALLARLDSAVEGMRRFTADASHQMRTPLSILRTHIGVLKTQVEERARSRSRSPTSKPPPTACNGLLIQLLTLARAEGAEPSGLALNEIDIERHGSQCRRRPCAAGAACRRRTALVIEGPRAVRRRVATRCCSPRCSATWSTMPCATTCRRWQRDRFASSGDDEHVSVEVEDDGPGIPGRRARQSIHPLLSTESRSEPPRQRTRPVDRASAGADPRCANRAVERPRQPRPARASRFPGARHLAGSDRTAATAC